MLSERSSSFNDQIRGLAYDARDLMTTVRNRVSRLAIDCEMSSRNAEDEVSQVVGEMGALDVAMQEGIQEVSSCGGELTNCVNSAVRSLQFEDIATQSLGAANDHLDRLAEMRSHVAELQSVLEHSDATDADIEAALDRIEAAHQALAQPLHNPVSQTSMDEGDVELF